MYSTHEAELDIPSLPITARRVHIVPALSTHSLLSMGQLCDSGCTVTFTASDVHVHLADRLLLSGSRTPDTGLWHLSLIAPDPPRIPQDSITTASTLLHHSYAAVQSATPTELVAFAHAALFSPALSTLKTALDRGYLPHFMGLTTKAVTKHPPQSVAMIKGHLDQSRKNQRSTKPKTLPDKSPLDLDLFPDSDPKNHKTHECFAAIIEPSAGQIHTDQTGRFVVASSIGNNYILVLYDYDSNGILTEAFATARDPAFLPATKYSMRDSSPLGCAPNFSA